MEKGEINLGSSPKEAMNGPMIKGMDDEQIVYPTFRYSGPLDLDLPEHGDMRIHFRKLNEEFDIDPETGKHTHYECTIQVRKLSNIKEAPDITPAHSRDEAGDALDAIAKGLAEMREHEESEDDEGDEY